MALNDTFLLPPRSRLGIATHAALTGAALEGEGSIAAALEWLRCEGLLNVGAPGGGGTAERHEVLMQIGAVDLSLARLLPSLESPRPRCAASGPRTQGLRRTMGSSRIASHRFCARPTCLAPFEHDGHPDHDASGRAASLACAPAFA